MRDEKSQFGKDRRRRHHHFLVTVNYADGETFGRVYTNKDKATKFRRPPAPLASGEIRSRHAGFLSIPGAQATESREDLKF